VDFNKTRSSADAEKPVRCDIIRNEEKYQQVLRRHTAICGGRINVSAASYSNAIAQHYQTENFEVHPSDRLPFPLEFRNPNAILENHSGRATKPRKSLMISLAV